jgi:hypothetical protein
MVSNPFTIDTFGLTGALFISVAGTGGTTRAGTGWAGGAGATATTWFGRFTEAFFFFVIDACGFRGALACAPETCAWAPPEIMASAHAITIIRLIASSAVPGLLA